MAGALRSACVIRVDGNAIASSSPCSGARVDDRTTRIPEPEKLGDLVVRLTRGIIPSPADPHVRAGRCHQVEARVAARNDEHDQRQFNVTMLEKQRFDMAGQVMDRHERTIQRHRQRLSQTTRPRAASPQDLVPA